jgi:hypothetical protein
MLNQNKESDLFPEVRGTKKETKAEKEERIRHEYNDRKFYSTLEQMANVFNEKGKK